MVKGTDILVLQTFYFPKQPLWVFPFSTLKAPCEMGAWTAILLCFEEFTIRNGSAFQKYNKCKSGIQTLLILSLYFLD